MPVRPTQSLPVDDASFQSLLTFTEHNCHSGTSPYVREQMRKLSSGACERTKPHFTVMRSCFMI